MTQAHYTPKNQTPQEIKYLIELAKIEKLSFEHDVETSQRSIDFANKQIKRLITEIKTLKKRPQKIKPLEAEWIDINGNTRTFDGVIKTK